MKTFLLKIEDEKLWKKFKLKLDRSKSIHDHIVDLIREKAEEK